MTDEKCEREEENTDNSNLQTKVVQYEHFLNDVLRGDLKYVNHYVYIISSWIAYRQPVCKYHSTYTQPILAHIRRLL